MALYDTYDPSTPEGKERQSKDPWFHEDMARQCTNEAQLHRTMAMNARTPEEMQKHYDMAESAAKQASSHMEACRDLRAGKMA
jgi:hypothetical protein